MPGNGDPDPCDCLTDAVAGPPDAGDACASLAAVLGAGSRLSRGIPVSVPVLGRRARPWPLPPSSSSLDGRRTRVVSRTGPGATTPGGSAYVRVLRRGASACGRTCAFMTTVLSWSPAGARGGFRDARTGVVSSSGSTTSVRRKRSNRSVRRRESGGSFPIIPPIATGESPGSVSSSSSSAGTAAAAAAAAAARARARAPLGVSADASDRASPSSPSSSAPSGGPSSGSRGPRRNIRVKMLIAPLAVPAVPNQQPDAYSISLGQAERALPYQTHNNDAARSRRALRGRLARSRVATHAPARPVAPRMRSRRRSAQEAAFAP